MRCHFLPNSARKSVKIDIHCANATFRMKHFDLRLTCTRGDQKVPGKVLLNRIASIDCNENS